ncbi:GINS complex, Sld5 component [Sistotremastrum suecicum HHB10207 ss-3]|uniref:DNA replication complex GINS protein SLD5 n=1 Tax=Sistotremastrum suecicum HHB10207 ss-3 TaxID=1314776 RepID=A0A166B0Q5_9AGAM|nr:GINS complex, Sld5 component [Sistotremastrum suecicum HHB10207 ss-3]
MAFDWVQDDDVPMAGPSFMQRVQNAMRDDDVPVARGPTIATTTAPVAQPVSRLQRDILPIEERPIIQQLMQHWLNERAAPDVLPCRLDLLNDILEKLSEQASLVTRLRADPDTSEEEHFQMMLVQTEMERVRFIVRSYLRTRLYKLENLAQYVMSQPGVQANLSATELQHARNYSKLVANQFNSAVMVNLPEAVRALDDDSSDMGIPPMVTQPVWRQPVFIHALRDCGDLDLNAGEKLRIEKGSIHLLPYERVQPHLSRGEIELI